MLSFLLEKGIGGSYQTYGKVFKGYCKKCGQV